MTYLRAIRTSQPPNSSWVAEYQGPGAQEHAGSHPIPGTLRKPHGHSRQASEDRRPVLCGSSRAEGASPSPVRQAGAPPSIGVCRCPRSAPTSPRMPISVLPRYRGGRGGRRPSLLRLPAGDAHGSGVRRHPHGEHYSTVLEVPPAFYTTMGLGDVVSPLRLRGMGAILQAIQNRVRRESEGLHPG